MLVKGKEAECVKVVRVVRIVKVRMERKIRVSLLW